MGLSDPARDPMMRERNRVRISAFGPPYPRAARFSLMPTARRVIEFQPGLGNLERNCGKRVRCRCAVPMGPTAMAPATHFDGVPPQRSGPASSDVRKAIDYMRTSIGRKITMADVAAVCGVAERTLRKHFRAFVGVSPLDYFRRLRLAAVRADLLEGANGVSITEVATRYGFSHFGRFSQEYRRCFGEAPSWTLRRRRAAAQRKLTGEIRCARATRLDNDNARVPRLARERPSVAVCRSKLP